MKIFFRDPGLSLPSALLVACSTIDKEDFEDLILGKKDLAEMHALKQAGLASATIDTFSDADSKMIARSRYALPCTQTQ
jgi:hypothetical protein